MKLRIEYKDRDLSIITKESVNHIIFHDDEVNDLLLMALEDNGLVEVYR